MRIFLAIASLAIAISIPFFYEEILNFFVVKLHSGWVFGSIYIRLLVIIFVAIAVHLIFSLLKKTKRIRFLWVFLLAIIPGFGISFIYPIYNTDYGLFHDEMKLSNINELEKATDGQYEFNGKQQILLFVTTSCPHCKSVSKKLGTNLKAGQDLPVHAFFPIDNDESKKFLIQNNAEEFHSYSISENDSFVKFAGHTFPSLYLIDNKGNTKLHFTGDVINYTALDHFLTLSP